MMEAMGSGALLIVIGMAACSFSPSPGLADAFVGTDAPPAPWWDPAYRHRRRIFVTANAAGVPQGVSVAFVADTAALVPTLVRADAHDWRVVAYDGTYVEHDRWIDDIEGGGWNTATTWTWFQLGTGVAPGQTDASNYAYYSSAGAGAPPSEMMKVFLFGDDFEAGTDKWTNNNLGETIAIDSTHRGGASGLRVDPGTTAAAGLHRDQLLPSASLLFSHYLYQDSAGSSFGDLRGFSDTFANRTPSWNENKLRVFAELDSSDALQVNGSSGTHGWANNFGAQVWHHVEYAWDFSTHQLRGRIDGGPWSAAYPDVDGSDLAIESFALEGENQGGSFHLDDYTIRFLTDPEPTVVLGPEETAP